MKKQYLILLAAAAAVLSACTADYIEEMAPAAGGATTLTAGIVNPGTRTTLGERDAELNARKVFWANGDAIRVGSQTSAPLSGLGSEVVSTTFTFASGVAAPYEALYPASFYTDATHITLPSEQAYVEGSFGGNSAPMLAYQASAGGALSFRHAAAVLHVQVNRGSEEHAIMQLTFSGNSGEQVCGLFEVNYVNATLSGASDAAADKQVIVRSSNKDGISDPVIDFFVVVPARTYAGGFSLRVRDTNGDYMVKSTSNSVTLAAGTVTNLSAFDFVSTGTDDNVVNIDSVDDLITFAQEYNAYKYYGISTLTVNINSDLVFDASKSAELEAIGVAASGSSPENYFRGTFDGKNHTISGLQTNNPLFAYTGSESTIKDLTLSGGYYYVSDANILFAGEDAYQVAPLVFWHKGTIENCHVTGAQIYNSAAVSMAHKTYIGGLVSRLANGTIKDSDFSGVITLDNTYSGTGNVYIGGIVGYANNDSGQIQSCTISSTSALTWQGNLGTSSDQSLEMYMGGIVGYLNRGTVTSCTTTAGASLSKSATKTSPAIYCFASYMGGIAGRVGTAAVIDGTVANNAALSTAMARTAANNPRKEYVGGIAGYNSGTITGDNAGAVNFTSVLKDGYYGGIAGYNNGTLSGSQNTGNLYHSSGAARHIIAGGIIGHNHSSNVSSVTNSAQVYVREIESTTNQSYMYLGGCIGYNDANLAGNNTIINEEQVAYRNPANLTFDKMCLGGVIGFNDGAEVSGLITRDPVARAEVVLFNCNSKGVSYPVYIGGVIGENSGTAHHLTNNCSSHELTNVYNTVESANPFSIGGVIGYNSGSVNNLQNNGQYTLKTTPVNSNAYCVGGVIGQNTASAETLTNNGAITASITGTGTNNFCLGGVIGKNTVAVSGLNNNGAITVNNTVESHDIYVGGAVGYSTGNITTGKNLATGTINYKATFAADGDHSITDACVGGVLGYSGGTAITLLNCENRAQVKRVKNATVIHSGSSLGGIVGKVSGVATTLDNCDNYGNTEQDETANAIIGQHSVLSVAFTGGIVGWAEGAASDAKVDIKNCDNTTPKLYARRGYIGGIAGYAKHAKISSNTFTPTASVNYSICQAGMAAWAIDTSIEGCTVKGNISTTAGTGDNSYTNPYIAGIAGYLDGTSSVSSSRYYGDLWVNHASRTNQGIGAIAGEAVSGAAISNCHFGGRIATDNSASYTAIALGNALGKGSATISGSVLWDGE